VVRRRGGGGKGKNIGRVGGALIGSAAGGGARGKGTWGGERGCVFYGGGLGAGRDLEGTASGSRRKGKGG